MTCLWMLVPGFCDVALLFKLAKGNCKDIFESI